MSIHLKQHCAYINVILCWNEACHHFQMEDASPHMERLEGQMSGAP